MQNNEVIEGARLINRLINAVANNTKLATVATEKEEHRATEGLLKYMLKRKPSKLEINWTRDEVFNPSVKK